VVNVLLVEDDLDLAATVIDYLELESIECDHAANGVAGLTLARQTPYQVLLLDLNLPRMDGLTVCQTLRAEGVDIPVLMLTARDSLVDKLAGFKSGTDDYLVKPFAMQELVVRILALAKRRSGQANRIEVGPLALDLNLKQGWRDGIPLKLSPTTFTLLECLMRLSPQPVKREILIHAVWGDEQPGSNSLKVHMHNLRKQVDGPDQEQLVHTITGFGFALRSTSGEN
jgi:DNA-binding response OmpR family regulator